MEWFRGLVDGEGCFQIVKSNSLRAHSSYIKYSQSSLTAPRPGREASCAPGRVRVFIYSLAATLTLACCFFLDPLFTQDPSLSYFNYLQALSFPVVIYSNLFEDEGRLKKENRGKAGYIVWLILLIIRAM